jgi:quinoprotein glucose dehydrogenase
LLSHASETVRIAAAEAAAELALAGAGGPLASLAADLSAPAAARAMALRALATLKAPALAGLLKSSLDDRSEAVRLEASRLSAELNPNDAAGRLRAKIESGSLVEQQDALATLGTLKSDAADALLADYLDKLMNRSLPDEVKLDVVEAAKKRKANAVRERLAQYEDWRLPKDHLTPFREALTGGDAARGKKIFYENAAVACVRCHHIGNDGGGNAGPELTGVGARQQREYLLESIVTPNKQIAQGFETAMITLKGGALYAGIVKQETESQVILNSPEEGEIKIDKAQISERAKGLSGMPEGIPDLLNRFELRDLIEFLATQK